MYSGTLRIAGVGAKKMHHVLRRDELQADGTLIHDVNVSQPEVVRDNLRHLIT
jgi:hypothetical protein